MNFLLRAHAMVVPLILGVFFIWPGTSLAQAPGGSYTKTCKDISVNQRTLVANCKSRGGSYNLSNLPEFSQCIGDISNDDGFLRCNRGRKPPKGSYQATCEVVTVDELGGLRATCKDRRGNLQPTYLGKFEECVTDIFNDNGVLRCSKVPLVDGPYRNSCETASMNGTTLRAMCKMQNGKLVEASLADVDECAGPVENINGILDCIRGVGPFPAGSYRATCIRITKSESSLSAACVNINGSFNQSALDISDCHGEIRNVDGALTCNKGSGAAPAGSYQKSCRNVITEGSVVRASCRRGNGAYLDANLDTSGCSANSIQNADGRLVCTANRPSTQPIIIMTKETCASEAVPAGWIIVDTRWDPTACGRPPGITQNVRTIRNYDQLPVGTILQICAGQFWQSNWILIRKSWGPSVCGRPSTHTDNVFHIQRSN